MEETNIKTITKSDLRRMENQEGLILQGCGGDLSEWVDGINGLLSEAGILLNGSRFSDVCRFQYGGTNCLLFPFDSVELDIGKFAMWRLRTYEDYGGTWLSDFVPNRLGGFLSAEISEDKKPDCPLIGQDGNIFNLIGIASRTLRQCGQTRQAKEMSERVFASGSYEEALAIIGEYVNITSVGDPQRSSVREKLKDRPTEEAGRENAPRKDKTVQER